MKYRGYIIETCGDQYLIHTTGIYGYYYFPTVEAAKARVNEWIDDYYSARERTGR